MLPSYTTIPNRELNKLLMEKSNTGIMLLVNNKFNKKRNYRLWCCNWKSFCKWSLY